MAIEDGSKLSFGEYYSHVFYTVLARKAKAETWSETDFRSLSNEERLQFEIGVFSFQNVE